MPLAFAQPFFRRSVAPAGIKVATSSIAALLVDGRL
jgi:hypothetical protein